MGTTHTQDTDELVPIGRAAGIAHFSADTLRRYSRTDKLTTYWTPGGQRRFRVSDLLALNAPASQSSDAEAGAFVVSAPTLQGKD